MRSFLFLLAMLTGLSSSAQAERSVCPQQIEQGSGAAFANVKMPSGLKYHAFAYHSLVLDLTNSHTVRDIQSGCNAVETAILPARTHIGDRSRR